MEVKINNKGDTKMKKYFELLASLNNLHNDHVRIYKLQGEK
tara:strand:+ start:479 stop:601 length:123 start_codon:yes stop_codon:yes gene_type:complete